MVNIDKSKYKTIDKIISIIIVAAMCVAVSFVVMYGNRGFSF